LPLEALPKNRGSPEADAALSGLLIVQGITLFIALPWAGAHAGGRMLLDLCHLAFALLCTRLLTRRRTIRWALIAGVVLMAVGPATSTWTEAALGEHGGLVEDLLALISFSFNSVVTLLVFRSVFSPGPVNSHRVQGAVLLYLNVAALFAILYSILETRIPGAFLDNAGAAIGSSREVRAATLSYFSLATITTTGYGDLAPVHPVARSLANFEAVFGTLYPATLLARLVGLHLQSKLEAGDAT
jgi:Ion channel